MLIYACSVVLLAISSASLFINVRLAETERVLITLASVALFTLGAYGMWVWLRRKNHRPALPAQR